MCGINGFTGQDPDALRRMHRATRNRGPDDEGFFESPDISLAHNRLSIIDLSPAGHQPMASHDGRYVVVFNGEIYNYRELRGELETTGEKFAGASDTEVLLAAYARWGEGCLPKLNGMFAFAIWDRQLSELFLARDAFGIKPLYYAEHQGKLLFSSELKSILAYGYPRTLDADALNLYFRLLYVPGPRTAVRGIKKLQPGCLLRASKGASPIVRKWHETREGEYLTHFSDASHLVRSSVEAAVRRQLVSDRPVGVFLSGGIDSTLITGIMSGLHAGPVKTFSIGYEATEQEEKYNADAVAARLTAKYFSTEHHHISFNGKKVAEQFETIIAGMDELVSNHVQPSNYFLAEYAKPHITVALGGDGADELFGGYGRYWFSHMISRFHRIPPALRPDWMTALIGRVLGQPSLSEKVRTKPGVERHMAFIGEKNGDVEHLVRSNLLRTDIVSDVFAEYYREIWKDVENQFMAVDTQTWLADESLIRSDRMSMAHALEQRVPFLDMDVAHVAAQIPSRFKIDRRDLGKKILRSAFSDLLPAHVASQSKRGFFSPAAKWLRGDMLPLARELLSVGYAPETSTYIDLDAARTLLDEHVAKRGYHLNAIWAVMTFQVWWKKVFSC